MAGLSNASFVGGLMDGANFVAGMQDRQQRSGLMQAQEQRAQVSHGLQVENAKQQQEINAIRVKDLNDEHADKMNKAMAWSLHSMKDAPEETKKFLSLHPNLDASRIMSPEYGQAIDMLEKASQGGIDYRHPDVAKAFDMVNPEIGLGATLGRKVSTSRLYPGPTPGTVMVGLRVDGDQEERPLTENRSSDPGDPVKEVRLEDLIGRVQVAKQYRGFLADPENQKWFIQQTIGPELAKSKLDAMKAQSQISKDSRDLGDKSFSASQADPVSGLQFQVDGNGKRHYAPQPRAGAGGGGAQSTQRQKDYEFAASRLGMDENAALEWASSDKTPTERAEAYANRMVQAETSGGNVAEGYSPNAAWKAHREAFMGEYGNFGKQPKPKDAAPQVSSRPPSNGGIGPLKAGASMVGQFKQAPAAALEALRNNPELSDQFQAKFGYLPEYN